MLQNIHKECLEIAGAIENKMRILQQCLEENPEKNISIEVYRDFRSAFSTINDCLQQINS